jgi:predicted component of type VI protein secretion system
MDDRSEATDESLLGIVMSIEDELLGLAKLCRSQARLTQDRTVKQALRKLGDHYENEAQKLQAELSVRLQHTD